MYGQIVRRCELRKVRTNKGTKDWSHSGAYDCPVTVTI